MTEKVTVPTYRSFLLRLWREEVTELVTDWHSEVEHIQSGTRWTFATLAELLNFLDQQAEHLNLLEQSKRT
ncbi:MAG: hypothetical protein M3220_14145 [Chloroflexota bacterium]|nr:hypothetical protein [Chloroflexota bacterium]